jgi:hypothetical protein
VNVHFDATSPYGPNIFWDLWWYGKFPGYSQAAGSCCSHVPSTKDRTIVFNREGLYMIGVNAIDSQLNETQEYRAVVKIGNAPTGSFPTAVLNLDKVSGVAPLTVQWDASQSYDTDGYVDHYLFQCDWVRSPVEESAVGSCLYDKPGVYVMQLMITDDSFLPHTEMRTIVVSPDVVNPVIQITTPTNNDTVDSTLFISADATDDSGVAEVRFFMDGKLIGADLLAPYEMSLDVSQLGGVHSIFATTTDFSDNVGTSQTVNIHIVDHLAPTATLISPLNDSVQNHAFALAASATDNDLIERVEFYVDGQLAAKDFTFPYDVSWDASLMELGAHEAWAVAFDREQNQGSSSRVAFDVGCGTMMVRLSSNTVHVRSDVNPLLVSQNGKPEFFYRLMSGELPMGITLSSNGILTGQPIALESSIFQVQSTDSRGCSGTNNLSLDVTGVMASNFEDGLLNGWKIRSGAWTIVSGELVNTTTKSARIETIATMNCASCTYDLDVIPATPNGTTKITFWYKDNSNQLQIQMLTKDGKVSIKYISGGAVKYKKKVPYLFTPGALIRIRASYSSGRFNIFFNEFLLQTFTASTQPQSGRISLQNKHAVELGTAVPTTILVPGVYVY